MIIANITSYYGQADAEHYYCEYHIIEEKTIDKQYNGTSYDETELKRKITSTNEAIYLNKKDSSNCWKIGSKTNRFNTIEEIHTDLINLFPDHTIVTYNEGILFKEMLCYVKGENLGYKYFGEVWNNIPTSCYKELLPTNGIKIKCDDCGKEYSLDEVSYETEHLGKPLIQFMKKRDMDELCCKYFNLVWNVIL